jgi:hypothetical protein
MAGVFQVPAQAPKPQQAEMTFPGLREALNKMDLPNYTGKGPLQIQQGVQQWQQDLDKQGLKPTSPTIKLIDWLVSLQGNP